MKRHYLFFVLLGVFIFPLQDALSQETAEKLRDGFLVTGKIFKRQFRELLSRPHKSTVRFYKDGKPQALGVIVGADGWILTKASQLGDAGVIRTSTDIDYDFKYVGYHTDLDLAMVKIEAKNLPVIEWQTATPSVGQWMLTVGIKPDPVGIGVMSVPRRKIPSSGDHGVLGIELERVDEPIIKQVFANSGAQSAGLKSGDVILEVDGLKITTGQSLIRKLRNYRPGDTLVMKYTRDNKESSVSCTLTHPFGDFLSRIAMQNQMGGSLSFRRDNFEAVYQHDTVLAPEDCGGPVVDLDGKAFGINIARAGRTTTYVLPADLILPTLDDLKSGKLPPPIISESAPAPSEAKVSESSE